MEAESLTRVIVKSDTQRHFIGWSESRCFLYKKLCCILTKVKDVQQPPAFSWSSYSYPYSSSSTNKSSEILIDLRFASVLHHYYAKDKFVLIVNNYSKVIEGRLPTEYSFKFAEEAIFSQWKLVREHLVID